MTYCNPALPYRADFRSRPSEEEAGPLRGAWYEVMLLGLLSMLSARGVISPARYRRFLPERARRRSYVYHDIRVPGCRHLRADVRKRSGLILGDLELYEDSRKRERYGLAEVIIAAVYPALKPGGFGCVWPQCKPVFTLWPPIRGSPCVIGANATNQTCRPDRSPVLRRVFQEGLRKPSASGKNWPDRQRGEYLQ